MWRAFSLCLDDDRHVYNVAILFENDKVDVGPLAGHRIRKASTSEICKLPALGAVHKAAMHTTQEHGDGPKKQ